VLDLAVAVALGGDCAADVAVVRAQPGVFGLVASDPTVSRLVTTLTGDVEAALGAIASARAAARERVWGRAGAPVQDGRVAIDLMGLHHSVGRCARAVFRGRVVSSAAGR
jgi:hypothetical protein